MGFDLMSYFRDAWSWAGGAKDRDGAKVEGGASAGASAQKGTSTANDLLGGMVGGFSSPMEWKGAGFGGAANGKVTDRDGTYVGGMVGGGAGGGFSSWRGVEDGFKTQGGSLAGGAVAPVGVNAGNRDIHGSASTNVYTGVGGSAYSYGKGSDHGYGAKANYVPIGAMDTNVGVTTDYGSAKVHADDMYLGKVSSSSKFGEKDGTYYGDVSASQKIGASGVNGQVDTALGTYKNGAGSVTYGPAPCPRPPSACSARP